MDAVSFDDLIPAGGAAPAAPAMPPVAQGGGVSFDDLIPSSGTSSAPPNAPPADPSPSPVDVPGARPLTIHATASRDKSATVDPEGTGQANYDTPDDPTATPGQRIAAIPGMAANLAVQAGQGVPLLGAGVNRAAAALAMPFNGQSYADNLSTANQGDAQFTAQHPLAAGAANAAGATAGTLALPEAALGLGEGSLLTRAGIAAGAQGALGGVDAAVRGQNPVLGVLGGAGGGAAGPVIGAGVGSVARYANSFKAPVQPELQGISRTGMQMLQKGIGDATPEQLQTGAASIGQNGFLGETTPGLMDTMGGVADTPGAGKAVIRDAYAARNAGSMDRHSALMDQAFGPQVDMATLTRQTKADRSAAADPLYAAWRATRVPATPELDSILEKPSVKAALPGAQRLAGDEGQSIYDPQGNLTAQGWDYVKRATDDQARSYGYGTNGFRVANSISREITTAIDNHPDPNVAGVWQQARKAWSDPTSIMNARELGQTAFSKAQRPDEMVYDVQGLSAPERTAYLQGVRDNVGQMMDASRRGDTTTRNILLSPGGQAKLQTVVGPDQAKALTQSLTQEQGYRDAAQNISGGSQTTPKAERVGLVTPNPESGLLGAWHTLYNARPLDQPGSVLPKFLSPQRIGDTLMGNSYERARAQIAPKLVTQGEQRDALMQALLAARQRQAAATPNTDPLVRALAAARQATQQRALQ